MSVEQARTQLELGQDPSQEYLLDGFNQDKSDAEIWSLCQKTMEMQTAPDKERIKNKALESIVLVDQIPDGVTKEKMDRLGEVMKKKINERLTEQEATHIELKKLDIPFSEETGKNKGFALISFSNEQQANQFQQLFNDYRMTKKSVWKTYNLSQIDRYSRVSETWEAPKKVEKEVDYKDLEGYLNDENDQFMVMAKGNLKIYLNQAGYGSNKAMAPGGPITLLDREGMGADDWDSIRWSPKGTYVLVFDRYERGLGMFGGRDMGIKERIQCQSCFNAAFSPDEQFIMTQSGKTDENGRFIDCDVKAEVSVWNIMDGEKKKNFQFRAGNCCAESWERFQWSPTGQFLATTKKDYLCIFDAWNNFQPLNDPDSPIGAYIHVPGLASFTFSPTEDHICYWVPECGERPLRVCIRDLQTLKQIRVKNLFNVKELDMLWHPQGTFLAVKVSKTLKGKKGFLYNTFELFHMKEKEIPVDTVEIQDHQYPYDVETGRLKTENLGTMAWEPRGTRFSVMYGPNDAVTKTQVKLYKLQNNGKVMALPPFERSTQFNTFSWSPTGRYMMLCQLKKGQSSGGALEWIDANGDSFTEPTKYNPKKKNELNKPVSIATNTHQFVTDVEWDSTGRYVVTSASALYHKMENGYQMWNFLGRELYVQKIEGCQVVKWRPRPACDLTDKQTKHIKNNMSSYAKIFIERDHLNATQVGQEEQKKIQELMAIWNDTKMRYQEEADEQAEYERKIFAQLDDEGDDWEEVQVNNLLNIKTEIRGRQKVLGNH